MTDQQLYIDGILMDMSEDSAITLDIKSNLFRDITKMTANTTYTINLPKTAHNMAVLEFAGKPSTSSKYPYIFHTARYFRNGLEIIHSGRASVLSVKETIEISIYWGLFQALATLQSSDLKLNELNCTKYLRFTKDNSPYTYEKAIADGVFYGRYETAVAKTSSDEWMGFDQNVGGNSDTTYSLVEGKIRTGTEVGKYVSGEVLTDETYLCAIIPFEAGMRATIGKVLGKGQFRTWAILDTNKNVLSLADDAGNTAQEFYTNRTVVQLMAEILQPQPNESIYDPTCGSGGMLVKCLDYLRNKGAEWQSVQVFGQEVNGLTSSIARMNLYLNGVEDFSIACADTLEHPAFLDGSHLRKFDIVLANPPYSIKEWNREKFMNDKWGRNFLGTPPQGRADYAFFQHIIASMDRNTGRCAILFPHGVLFRDEEYELRKKLVEIDIVDCVIGLGPNLFFNASMEACIIICKNRKEDSHKGKVIFIDAKGEVSRKNAESYLENTHIQKIISAYENFEDIEYFAKVADINDIDNNKSLLSIQSYVKQKGTNEIYILDESLPKWIEASRSMHIEVANLLSMLKYE